MSFRLKTILGVALIEIAFLLILVFNSLDFLRSSNENEIEQRTQNTLNIFASMVKDAVLASDIASLEEFVKEIIKQPEVNYVQILDLDQVLAERYREGVTAPGTPDLDLSSVDDGTYDLITNIEEAGIVFGSVRIGFLTGRLETLVAGARDRLFLIAGIEVVLVAIFSYYLGLFLTRQLDKLRQATRRVAKGEYGVQVKPKGQDELAQAIRSFNKMSVELASNHLELQKTLSELKIAKDKTSENLLRTKAVLDVALDGILTLDERGIIADINPAGERLFQYPREALLGKSMTMLLEAEDTQEQHSIEGQTSCWSIENILGHRGMRRAIKRDGTCFPIDLSVSEIEFKGQKTVVGLVRDLTEREAYQKEVAAQHALHKAITESSLDAMVTINNVGTIQEFSPAAEKLFGFARNEALGRNLTETIVPESAIKAHSKGMERYHKTGHGPVIRNRIQVDAQHKDGHLIPVEMVVTPIEVESKSLFTAFIHDISERKAYEKSLEVAKQQAEAGSEAKSRFLATMSHEIRSPLNAILGSLDLLEETNLSRKQCLYTQTAFDAGRALLGLINDILDFSKIEAGQLELDIGEFAPENLVNEVMHICQAKAQTKGVDLACFLAKDVPDYVIGDQTRLRQVMINLLDNAIKFSDKGVVSLEVNASNQKNGVVELSFNVSDQGIGIPHDKLEGLFDEFTQVDASHSTRYGGTGLGLAICARLVGMMNGEIAAESRPGEGAEFFVRVELGSCDRQHRRTDLPRKNMRVLICHQNAKFRALVVRQYRDYGVQTEECGSFDQDALPALFSDSFDLIIIDENLYASIQPQAWQLIYEQWLHEKGQIVLLASVNNESDHHVLLQSGDDATGLLTKPLTRYALLETLAVLHLRPIRATRHLDKAKYSPESESLPILLAEDSPANQVVARAMLEGAGFKVEIANNGIEAVDCIREGEYCLVLMDMRMPDMDGLQATQMIRKIPEKADLPIIALTANAAREDIDACLASGMNAYLSKPIRKDKLVEAISSWLSHDNKPSDLSMASVGKATEQSDDIGADALILEEDKLHQLAAETSAEAIPAIIEGFISECRGRVERISAADFESNLILVEDEAHTIKSSAILFGCIALHELAKLLEADCRAGNLSQCLAMKEKLPPLAEASFDALQQFLQGIEQGTVCLDSE